MKILTIILDLLLEGDPTLVLPAAGGIIIPILDLTLGTRIHCIFTYIFTACKLTKISFEISILSHFFAFLVSCEKWTRLQV